MSTLTGNSIASTYESLIKVGDNTTVDSNLKPLSDGVGNQTALSLSNQAVEIDGTLTVTQGITASLEGTASYAVTASYVETANSASYALTASYALNGGGTVTIDTGSFATTGSNIFIGDQVITGSIDVSAGVKGLFFRNQTSPVFTNIITTNESIFNPTNLTILPGDLFIIEENADYYVLGDIVNNGTLIVSGTLMLDGALISSGSTIIATTGLIL